jgi:hypothetical protein
MMMLGKKSSVWILLGLAVLAVVAYRVWRRMPPYEWGLHAQVTEGQTASRGPVINGCHIFPIDNVWNVPIDKLPKDPHSEAYSDSVGPLKKLHADFGSSLKAGIPYTEVPIGTSPVDVDFENPGESDPGPYPFPKDAPIEAGSDHHVILVDPMRCMLYEVWEGHPNKDGSWGAGSGIKMDLTSNTLRRDGITSADAAGLPILPGLVRYDEVMSGEIRHALRFTVPHTQMAYVWPARHQASRTKDGNLPPMGQRFRLRADFDISRYSKNNQVIMLALQRYGMFLADGGSPMFLSGVSDKRWDDSDLHKLGAIAAEDFEAVDESSLQISPDSAAVNPAAVIR